MAYRIKIIVKNTKPPVWRQIIIPDGITFSELGIIINEIYGLDHYGDFQFEFFKEKVQLEEEKKGKVFQPSFHYDLQEASNTYIDDYFESGKWCSYYKREDAFRVEIQETIDSQSVISVLKTKGEFKENSPDCAQLTKTINQNIQIVTLKSNEFETVENLVKKKPIKIYRTDNPQSAQDNIRKSADSIIKEMSDKISEAMKLKRKEIERLGETINSGENENAKEQLHELLMDIYNPALENLQNSAMKNYRIDGVEGSDDEQLYLRDCFWGCSKNELNEIAKDMHIRGYGSMTRAALSEKVAAELLNESVMKKTFELYTDEEMEAFEYAVSQKGIFYPTDKVFDLLLKPYEQRYVQAYEDESVEVPVDVARAYQKINTKEFQIRRRRKVWLLDCINMIDRLYLVAPIDILIQMYEKRKGYRINEKEIRDLFAEIPQQESLCVLHGNRFISEDFLEDNRYKNVERSQGDKPFYIPSYEETIDYMRNHYLSKESSYRKLLKFFVKNLGYDEFEANDYMITIYHYVSLGWSLHDIMDLLQEWDVVFNNEEDLFKITELMTEVNNNTRMVVNRGHKPDELFFMEQDMIRKTGRMPTIVPGSSHAAQMLMESKDEIEQMGFSLDFDSNADSIPVASVSGDRKNVQTSVKKVYPNDLCPCGSGKKYKHCCGRKK